MDPVEAAFTHPNLLSFLPNFLQGLVYFEAEVNANCSVPGFPTVILPGFTGLLFWVYTRYLIHPFRVTGQQGRIILPSTTVGPTRNSRVHMYFILSLRHLRFNRGRNKTTHNFPYWTKNINFLEMRLPYIPS